MAAAHRLLIHAGFHKTGTKTLQASLRANSTVLGALGWRVETLPDNPAMRAVTEAARAFSVSGSGEDLALLRAGAVIWLAELDLRPGEGVMISSEDLSGHMPGMHGLSAYRAPGPVLAALVATAREVMGEVDCAVLFTTRAPDSWMRSLYWQQAKHPHLTDDFAAFAARLPRAADLSAPIRRARRHLGPEVPVHEVALEKIAVRPLGPVEALFDLAGIGQDDRSLFAEVGQRNSAPAPDLAEAFVALNRLGLPPAELRNRKEALLKATVSPGRGIG